MTSNTGSGGLLTDGTGVSALTASKLTKDFVADFLLTAAAAITTANIVSIQDAVQGPQVAAFAVAGALIRTVYRAVLKWSQS